jgi:hypothetical protein
VRCFGLYRLGRLRNSEITPPTSACCAFSSASLLRRRTSERINFHGGIHNRRAEDDKAYTPIARSDGRYRAAPLYYGMLMFAHAAPGALIPARFTSETSGLKAFAVRARDETLRVCLINQNVTGDERVATGAKVYCRVHVAAGRTSHRCHRRGNAWRCKR